MINVFPFKADNYKSIISQNYIVTTTNNVKYDSNITKPDQLYEYGILFFLCYLS